MNAEEKRVRYLVGELDSLRDRLQLLLDQAESLVHVFDEIDRLITRSDWSARRIPMQSKDRRKSKK